MSPLFPLFLSLVSTLIVWFCTCPFLELFLFFGLCFLGHKLFLSNVPAASVILSYTSALNTFILTLSPNLPCFFFPKKIGEKRKTKPFLHRRYLCCTQRSVFLLFLFFLLLTSCVQELKSLSALTHNSTVPTAQQVLQSSSLPFYIFYLLSVFCSISSGRLLPHPNLTPGIIFPQCICSFSHSRSRRCPFLSPHWLHKHKYLGVRHRSYPRLVRSMLMSLAHDDK